MHKTVPPCVPVLIAGACLLGSAAAVATDIYKWVTPDGVTHYSETPPGSAFAAVEVMALEPAPPPGDAAHDYRSALEVAKSLEAGRLERERLRQERRRLQRDQQPRTAPPEIEYRAAPVPFYYPPYLRYPPPAYVKRYGIPPYVAPPRPRERPPAPEPRPNSLAHIRP